MARYLYSAAMSLDGFIAGPEGDMSWLAEYVDGAGETVDALVPQIGALLVRLEPLEVAYTAPITNVWARVIRP
jgi:hypothetical protein